MADGGGTRTSLARCRSEGMRVRRERGRPYHPGKGQGRVVVLNHFAADHGSPGGTRHVDLFSRLKRWDATIIASNRNLFTRATVEAEAPMVRTVWTSRYASNGLARVMNWITYAATSVFAALPLRATVVYASSPHLLAGLAGWLVASVQRSVFVFEVRDLWPKVLIEMGSINERSILARVLRRLEEFLYRRARAIVVFSSGVECDLTYRGIEPHKVVVIPNGADPGAFEPPADHDQLRRRFGFRKFTIVYTGAHGPANGLEFVLEAATEIQKELDVEFVLLGDGVEKQKLIAEAARRKLMNVRFMDPIPKSEMPALLGAADAGLHVLADVPMFRYGVSPNKLYDYMAAGLPVITNTPGETAELVRRANAGIAVEPSGVAEGVREMLRVGEEQRLAWGTSAREFMQRHRSRAVLAAKLEALLDNLVM